MSGTFPNVREPAVAAGGKATVRGALVGPLQLTVVPGDSPSGTGAVTFRPAAPSDIAVAEEPMYDSAGDALELDLSAQVTHTINTPGWFSEISVAGADFTLIVADSA